MQQTDFYRSLLISGWFLFSINSAPFGGNTRRTTGLGFNGSLYEPIICSEDDFSCHLIDPIGGLPLFESVFNSDTEQPLSQGGLGSNGCNWTRTGRISPPAPFSETNNTCQTPQPTAPPIQTSNTGKQATNHTPPLLPIPSFIGRKAPTKTVHCPAPTSTWPLQTRPKKHTLFLPSLDFPNGRTRSYTSTNLPTPFLEAQAPVKEATRPYTCPMCNKSFKQPQNKSRHIKSVHWGIKPYICSDCGKRFASKQGKKKHIQSQHARIKPYVCHHCSKGFSSNRIRKDHIQAIHLRLKAYACPQCNKRFGYKTNRDGHVKAVHFKIKPFACPVCKKKLASKASRRNHMKRIHKISLQKNAL